MKVGDYVKYKELSKSGRVYWVNGVIIDAKDLDLKMINETYYTILTEDGEEVTKLGNRIEPNIEMERDVKLRRIFRKD